MLSLYLLTGVACLPLSVPSSSTDKYLYRQFWPQGNSGQVGETVPQLLSSFQTFIWLINWSLISLQPTGIVHSISQDA